MTSDGVRTLRRIRYLGRTGGARAIRIEAGIGLTELASVIGSAPSSVSRWERGQVTPRPGAAIAWARALEAVEGGTE